MRMRLLEHSALALLIAALATAAHADAPAGDESARVVGTAYHWSLSVKGAPTCEENWTFAEGGVLTVVSGQEISTDDFTLAKVPDGSMFDLASTRRTTNAMPDCQGMVNATVGQVRHVYLQFLNDGGFFTCANTDTMSCYGVATPRPKPEVKAP
jgi:hypothetical protein